MSSVRECTPAWEPDAVERVGLLGLYHWRCACGEASLAPYIGQENAHADFVQHVVGKLVAL